MGTERPGGGREREGWAGEKRRASARAKNWISTLSLLFQLFFRHSFIQILDCLDQECQRVQI